MSFLIKHSIDSSIYLHLYRLIVSHYIEHILILLLIYLDAQIVPVLASGITFKLTSIFLSHKPCRSLSAFWHSKTLQARLYFLSPSPGISHFSKEPWFLLVENCIQKPRSEGYVCSLLLGYFCSQAFSMASARVYIHTFLYLLKTVNSHRCLQLESNPRVHSSFPPLCICNCLF